MPLPQSGYFPGRSQGRTTSGSSLGSLRITVAVIPPRNQPHHSSSTPQPVELPKERAGPSKRSVPAISFGTPPDDRMSIAASEGETELSGEEDSAALPPSGSRAMPESDPEMTAMLAWAA